MKSSIRPGVVILLRGAGVSPYVKRTWQIFNNPAKNKMDSGLALIIAAIVSLVFGVIFVFLFVGSADYIQPGMKTGLYIAAAALIILFALLFTIQGSVCGRSF
jgi:hypothetical protein